MTKVVMGIVDDGIAIAHERFRDAAGRTRIAYAWRQDLSPHAPGSAVPNGVEIKKADIDALVPACTHGGLLDEDEFYRKIGWIDIKKRGHQAGTWRIAHGTHVMDLACGFEPAEDRKDRPIICVQLPSETTANTSQAAHSQRCIDALMYILDRADKVAHGRPVVINFSYGAFAGPHDGKSHVEAMIDAIVAARKAKLGRLALEVVLPAGNGHLARCHAQISFASTSDRKTLHWRIPPDDYSDSFVEVWLPQRSAGSTGDRIELTLATPSGLAVLTVGETPGIYEWKPAAEALCTITYEVPPIINRGLFLIRVNPTASHGSRALAPAGTWRIALANKQLSSAEVVHAWIERDDTPYGYPQRGRPSYFDDPYYVRYDEGGRPIETDDVPLSLVRRAGMINSIATGRHPIVVGGYMRREMKLARYSAGGPVDSRTGPDVVSVSEDSYAHRGVLAAGSRCGSVVALNGTSVAAPQLARFIADRLAAGLVSDRATIASLAIPVASFPPERGGAGRIEIPPVVRHSRYWS